MEMVSGSPQGRGYSQSERLAVYYVERNVAQHTGSTNVWITCWVTNVYIQFHKCLYTIPFSIHCVHSALFNITWENG